MTTWTQSVLVAFPLALPSEVGERNAIAIDGKTLRGSAKALSKGRNASRDERDGVPGVHLLSALSHRLGLTLAQQPVPDKGNEISCAPQLLCSLVLEGPVVTMDALLTQRSLAKAIVAKKGTT